MEWQLILTLFGTFAVLLTLAFQFHLRLVCHRWQRS